MLHGSVVSGLMLRAFRLQVVACWVCVFFRCRMAVRSMLTGMASSHKQNRLTIRTIPIDTDYTT